MEPAGTALRSTLDMLEWRRPEVPLLANLNAEAYADPSSIPIVLERQLSSPVRWADCVGGLLELGCDTFWELGPKRALTGMMKELAPQATALAVPSAGAGGIHLAMNVQPADLDFEPALSFRNPILRRFRELLF